MGIHKPHQFFNQPKQIPVLVRSCERISQMQKVRIGFFVKFRQHGINGFFKQTVIFILVQQAEVRRQIQRKKVLTHQL